MAQTRNQEYPYQYKTISVQGGNTCGYGASVNFNLPTNLLSIKNLFVHLRIQFAPTEPTINQKIVGIGQKTWPLDKPQTLMLPLNLSADINREIDLAIDLTQALDKFTIVPPSVGMQGYIAVGIQHPNVLSDIGKVKLWKMDMIYTSQGIR